MSQVTFQCPSCGKAHSAPVDRIPEGGARGPCTGCGTPLVVGRDGRVALGRPTVSAIPLAPTPDDIGPTIPLRRADSSVIPSEAPPTANPDLFRVRRPDGKPIVIPAAQIIAGLAAGRFSPWDQVVDDDERGTALEDHPAFREAAAQAAWSTPVACANHPKTLPERTCERCRRGYCRACVPAPAPGTRLLLCPACGAALGNADPRLKEKPFWERLDEVVAFPVTKGNWITTAGIGFLLWAGGFLPPITLVAYLVGMAMIIHVVARSAAGVKRLTMPDSADVVHLAGRGLLAVIVFVTIALPIIALNVAMGVSLVSGHGQMGGLLLLLNVPLLLFLFAYYPMAFGMVAVWGNWKLGFRPDLVIGGILKIPKDYAMILALNLATLVLGWVVGFFTGRIPLLGGIVESQFHAYFLLVEAHALGWTLWLREEDLGWS